MQNVRKMKISGFTLIELLVVIAIIALLLSIVLPSLRAVRQRAQDLVCRTNLRSLGMALRVYSESHDGNLFSYHSALYLRQLADQIGDVDKVRYCPATRVDETIPYNGWGTSEITWSWQISNEWEHGSYGMNGWLYSYPEDGDWTWVESQENLQRFAYPKTTEARSPASVPVFFDALWVDAWPKHTDTVPALLDLAAYPPDSHTGSDYPVNNHMRRLLLDRHRGLAGIVFLDGHVSSIELGQLWSFKWHREFVQSYDEMERLDGTPIYRRVR